MKNNRYDEIFTSKRIIKIRSVKQSDDEDSVHYVPDDELPDDITKIGFLLDTVQGWEEYNDPFKKFHNKNPKIVVEVYGIGDIILLESFDYFQALMESFLDKILNQNDGKSNTESPPII